MTTNKIYNPADQPKDWLIDHFVVRTRVFEKIFKDILTGKMRYPEQHYLIHGQRGMGKTTLLLRLKYEVENTPELNKWLIPVFFCEENYDLTSLSNLWEKLLKYLDELWDTGGTYYDKTEAFVGNNDYEKKCFDLLLLILKERKKKLLIFFDNFGQLFLNLLQLKEKQRLREVLMHCAELRIIGASAEVIGDLFDYSEPFYEFFKVIPLEGLSEEETFQLISKLQENSAQKINLEDQKGKIKTLAILSGGVIRTIMLIYEVILADKDGSALHDLEVILDKITPLYKHRVEDLPPQQRKIVDVIAKKWDAVSTKEIATNIRENGVPLPSKVISAQLQQLEKNNVVEKKPTGTKNHLYQIRERFFNIWYLMRHGNRADKCRVIWLTKFLELWYDDTKSLNSFLQEHIIHLHSGKYYPDSAILMAEALMGSGKLHVLQVDKLWKETSKILSDTQRKQIPDLTEIKLDEADSLTDQGNYQEAIEILETIPEKDALVKLALAFNYFQMKEPLKGKKIIDDIIPETDTEAYYVGMTYFHLGHYSDAIRLLKDYRGEEIADALFVTGKSYRQLGNYENAIKYLKKAIKLQVEEAWITLTEIYRDDLDDLKKANTICKKAVENRITGAGKEWLHLKFREATFLDEANKLISVLKDKLKEEPEDPDYNFLMGMHYKRCGELKNAKKYFKAAANRFSIASYRAILNEVILLEILIKDKNKKEVREHLGKIDEETIELPIQIIFVSLWEGQYRRALARLIHYFQRTTEYSQKENEWLSNIFLLLLAKKQYHTLQKLFAMEEFQLKDRFKPIYYALMHYLKDEYPTEYLRMGEELKKPVEDVMKKVEQMAVDYA